MLLGLKPCSEEEAEMEGKEDENKVAAEVAAGAEDDKEENAVEKEELICRVQSSSPCLVFISSLKKSSLISANPTVTTLDRAVT